MRFEPLDIPGSVLVHPEPHRDVRGFFARTVCVGEFAANGLPTGFVQSSISYNLRRGTVRGLHFQWPPSREGKLVRCVRGAVLDVLVDFRPTSAAYLAYRAVRLDEDNRVAVFIPSGVVHGFQTLADHTEVLYQMTDFHAPDLAAGVRWNDPAFRIAWPQSTDVVISTRDAAYPDFDRGRFEAELARRVAQ